MEEAKPEERAEERDGQILNDDYQIKDTIPKE